MNWFISLINNPYFLTGLSSWAIAQVLKLIIYTIVNKKFDILRLFGDGGMPSGHSATVTSLSVLTALTYGTGTFEFAISALLAIIVCHDAMGVRLETGKQAILINEIVKSFDILSKEELPEVKLKEFVGHTPIQVIAGIIIGFTNAFIMHSILF